MTYLMESTNEAERLLKKSDYNSSKHQLTLTGLKTGMTAIDAGGGAGFVSKIMAEMVGPSGKVFLLDQSQERLDAAKVYCNLERNIDYLQTSLEKIPLEEQSADYVFSRFVFEYLKNPDVVFQELLRLTKKGGKIVIGDLDNNMLSHYPLSERLENQLQELFSKIQKSKTWDPHAGRKIYNLFFQAGLKQIKVHLLPHHLIYGESDSRDLDNWTAKIDQVEKLCKRDDLKLSFDIQIFRQEFLTFFKDPGRFSYSPLILVEGIKD